MTSNYGVRRKIIRENVTMQTSATQSNISVRVLKILRTATVTTVVLYYGSLATGQTTIPANPSASDWKQVEAAMGRPGQIQPGDVIRFGMPRKDLHVVLDGVDIKPG